MFPCAHGSLPFIEEVKSRGGNALDEEALDEDPSPTQMEHAGDKKGDDKERNEDNHTDDGDNHGAHFKAIADRGFIVFIRVGRRSGGCRRGIHFGVV